MTYNGSYVSNSDVSIFSLLRFMNGKEEICRIKYDFEYETKSIIDYKTSYSDIIDFILAFEQIRIFSENTNDIFMFIELSGYNDFYVYENKYKDFKSGFHSKKIISLLDSMINLAKLRNDVDINSYDEFLKHPVWGIINVNPYLVDAIEEEYTVTYNYKKNKKKSIIYFKDLIFGKSSNRREYNQNRNYNYELDEANTQIDDIKFESNTDVENLFLLDNLKKEEYLNRKLNVSKLDKTNYIKCPIVLELNELQKDVIKAICNGNESEVIKRFQEGFNWEFSFDRNVNLLHLSIVFGCDRITNYLIDNNLNIFQNTSMDLIGINVFNSTFPPYLSALDLADKKGNLQVSAKLRERITLENKKAKAHELF